MGGQAEGLRLPGNSLGLQGMRAEGSADPTLRSNQKSACHKLHSACEVLLCIHI